jgi:N-acetylglucosamine kinase-like BadF-type ATPase
MSSLGYAVGVDGGGTKTIGEIADLNGASIATHTVGPTNPNIVGTEESARTLCTLVHQLCSHASCQPGDLLGITFGLAGGGAEKVQLEIQEKVTEGLHIDGMPDLPIQVVTDIRIALEGAFGGGAGITVVAGTGSSIMFKTDQGNVGLVGGWGRVLGDEGSGYFIGIEALRAVTRDLDGISGAGSLRDAIASRFGLDSRYRIIEAVYRQQFPVPSIAPLVFELAAQSDNVSRDILRRAAALLVDQAGSAISSMPDGPVHVVLSGGLLEHETVFKEQFIQEITLRCPRVHIQPPLFSPVQGAIMMALSLRREKPKV